VETPNRTLGLPYRSAEPPAFGFGKPVGKPRLPLKTEQIQKTKPKEQYKWFWTVCRMVRTGYRSVSSVNRLDDLNIKTIFVVPWW
jgi:hypothetical protein